MPIPDETKAPGEGKGTTLWLLKDASDRETAIATPAEDSLFDQLGYLVDFQGPNMTKEVTSDSYLDSTDSYVEKSGGDIDPGQIKLTVAYMPGNAVQRRIYNKFNSKGPTEFGLFRSKHISGAVDWTIWIIWTTLQIIRFRCWLMKTEQIWERLPGGCVLQTELICCI